MAKLKGTPRQIAGARADEEVDLLLEGGEVFSVTTKEWIRTDLAITDGVIVGWGSRAAQEVLDVTGCRLTPGFIDAHLHIESTKLWVNGFVEAVLPRGTTAIAADPHELANVFGVRGVVALVEATKDLPFTFGVCASSCVPASHFESPGARLDASDISHLLELPSVIGVAEMMNYPGVIGADPEVLAKIAVAGDLRVDGHAPGITGAALDAYLTAGIESDHECTTYEEAHEKRQKSMWVFLRQGSAAQNIEALAPSIVQYGTTRAALCSDDREPNLLIAQGHMNDCIRASCQAGISLEDALVMATANPADYHGFHHLGSLAPGFQADVVVFNDIGSLEPSLVLHKGRIVAREGRLENGVVPARPAPGWMRDSVRLARPLVGQDFRLKVGEKDHVRAITVRAGTIVTGEEIVVLSQSASGDVARLSVIERHRRTGRIGLGVVKGFGLRRGALASTVAHDAHNLMVVGGLRDSDLEDMALAANTLAKIGGGQIVCLDGQVLSSVALPIGGLMSDKSAKEMASSLDAALSSARDLGVDLEDPFMQLSFLGLSVIPELRLTDYGLVDVRTFSLTSLVVDTPLLLGAPATP